MLTYQCQTWSLIQDLERKLVTCETKCLKKAVNKTRRDKIRNEVIQYMAGAKPVLQHIKQQQIKWFGHITCMPINQPALWAYNTKNSGWRARGRPRKRWSDSVADTLKTQGMSLLQATHLATDRQLCPPRCLPVQAEEKSKSMKHFLELVCVFSVTLNEGQCHSKQYQAAEPNNYTYAIFKVKVIQIGIRLLKHKKHTYAFGRQTSINDKKSKLTFESFYGINKVRLPKD